MPDKVTAIASGRILPARQVLVRQPPTSFYSKAGRGLWNIAWFLLYRPSPRPLHGWRRMLLRSFGAKIGRGAKPYPSAVIWAPWNLVMGEHSTLGDAVDCYCVARVEIGDHASVSQRAYLCAASRDVDDPDHPLMTAPIVIERRSWVAAEAYVGPGVTVRQGGVVAARAVVVRDVESWSVVGGNPAKLIRKRQRREG
ncbi:MAG: putative colanic acid biosynthesis acetyltransferase [Sphingomonas bacterium]|uniref:putative colanic acid biosynthesis acetyltransferase n=1 Tax=Sphingomonas bacterium TaxID=1895847 RepID=UPI0026047971|nr:putative colanic acid biosynthesis acetyltransferase [Sphingomonas bacterium]MDB5711499.1 putative colanic acid biosynthesis acetyltransferase [Sphingomonas bacterium]